GPRPVAHVAAAFLAAVAFFAAVVFFGAAAFLAAAVVFLASVVLAASAVFFAAVAFFAAVFLRGAGPFARFSASISEASSSVRDSGVWPRRSDTLVSPSVTYGPNRPSLITIGRS